MISANIKKDLIWALSWTGSAFGVVVVVSGLGFLVTDGNPFADSQDSRVATLTLMEIVLTYAVLAAAATPLLAAFRKKLNSPLWSIICGALLATICYSAIFVSLDPGFGIDDLGVVAIYVGSGGGLLGWIVWRRGGLEL